MPFTNKITQNFTPQAGVGLTGVSTFTPNNVNEDSQQIAASAANHALGMAFVHATMEYLYIKSDQALDLYLNAPSTGSPLLHIPLAAGVPFIWHNQSGLTNPITGDVTEIYASNSSSTVAANLDIRVGRS